MKKQSKSIPQPEESLRKLNPRQERFCQLFATDREFFGNGVQSYIEAYNPDTKKKNWYQTARSRASELLTNPNVYGRINDLLESDGLNDQNVDKQLLFLINQDADFASKLGAMREYNKLKQRITDKMEVVTKQVVGFEFVIPEQPITKIDENNSQE